MTARSDLMTVFDKAIVDKDTTEWLRPRTTRRYLHPPAADRMFTLWTEGKVLFGENTPGEGLRDYEGIESWLPESSLIGSAAPANTALDFANYWTTVEGGTPVLKKD